MSSYRRCSSSTRTTGHQATCRAALVACSRANPMVASEANSSPSGNSFLNSLSAASSARTASSSVRTLASASANSSGLYRRMGPRAAFAVASASFAFSTSGGCRLGCGSSDRRARAMSPTEKCSEGERQRDRVGAFADLAGLRAVPAFVRVRRGVRDHLGDERVVLALRADQERVVPPEPNRDRRAAPFLDGARPRSTTWRTCEPSSEAR